MTTPACFNSHRRLSRCHRQQKNLPKPVDYTGVEVQVQGHSFRRGVAHVWYTSPVDPCRPGCQPLR